jgi:hypothetical protein
VLLDSLYAPRVGEKKDQRDPDAMAPFLEFAGRAADGKVTFVFTHLYPRSKNTAGTRRRRRRRS